VVLVLHMTRQSVVVIGNFQWGQTEKDFFVTIHAEKMFSAEKILLTVVHKN